MKAATKSSRGNKYAHLMCSANGLYFVHPIPVKSDASTAMEKFFRKFGIMTDLHTHNAFERTAGDYRQTANDHMVNCTTTEPHSPWQNRAEPGINVVKKHTHNPGTHPEQRGTTSFLGRLKSCRIWRSRRTAIARVSKAYSATRPTYCTSYTSTSTSPSTTWNKSWRFPMIVSFWAVGLVRRTTSVRRYATGS